MRQNLTPQELAEHFTLLPAEQELLANKTGANRLGFVVLLKYFQWEGCFPEHWAGRAQSCRRPYCPHAPNRVTTLFTSVGNEADRVVLT